MLFRGEGRGLQLLITSVTVGRRRGFETQHFQNHIGAGSLNGSIRSIAVVSRDLTWEMLLRALVWRERDLVGGPGARQGGCWGKGRCCPVHECWGRGSLGRGGQMQTSRSWYNAATEL